MFQRKIAEKLDNFKGEFHKRKTELTGQLNKLSTDITAANAQLVKAMKAGFENNQKQIMEANKKLAILEDEFAQVNKDLESTLVKLHQQDKTLLNLTSMNVETTVKQDMLLFQQKSTILSLADLLAESANTEKNILDSLQASFVQDYIRAELKVTFLIYFFSCSSQKPHSDNTMLA